MSNPSIAKLEEILNSVTIGLSKVTSKKMFGCHALWADGNVFALVWKHGRIGVKLPDSTQYQTLMNASGAEPWKAGPMQMSHWVLVPEAFHTKSGELKKWAIKAHGLCSKLEKEPKKSAPGKPSAKKQTKKKAK